MRIQITIIRRGAGRGRDADSKQLNAHNADGVISRKQIAADFQRFQRIGRVFQNLLERHFVAERGQRQRLSKRTVRNA